MDDGTRPLAVVTGASSGIGLELARQFAVHGYDLIIAAENDRLEDAARTLAQEGGSVETVQTDLATYEGVETLVAAIDRATRRSQTVPIPPMTSRPIAVWAGKMEATRLPT